MPTNPFPTRTQAQATAEVGVSIVAMLVRQGLGWEFRRTPQESDFGIDAYIDIVTEAGYVTGKSLAVQIKTGASYLMDAGSAAWRYRGDRKHINYYLNTAVPVLLLIVDPDSREAWWQLFDPYETDSTDAGWTMLIPRSNRFGPEAKTALLRLAGPSIDYLPHLEQHWMLGDRVKDSDLVYIQVNRSEIEACYVRPFARLFERLSCSRETILSARNKVDFLIDGYNKDRRYLFEIPEVCRWIEVLCRP